jgi:hypothetical protein
MSVIFNTASGKLLCLLYKLALRDRQIILKKSGEKEKTKNEQKMSESEKIAILRQLEKYHKANE